MSNRGRFDDCVAFAIEADGDKQQAFYDQAWEIAFAFGKEIAWCDADERIETAERGAYHARKVALAANDAFTTHTQEHLDILVATVDEWRAAYVDSGDHGFVDEVR